MSDAPARRRKKRAPEAPRSGGVSPRTLVGLAAGALMLGAALTAIGDLAIGPAVDLSALALAVYAAHRIGRMGPDPGTVREIPLDADRLHAQNLG